MVSAHTITKSHTRRIRDLSPLTPTMIVADAPRHLNSGTCCPYGPRWRRFEHLAAQIAECGEFSLGEDSLPGALLSGIRATSPTARVKNRRCAGSAPRIETIRIVLGALDGPSVHRPRILWQRGLHRAVAQRDSTV